MESEVDLIIAYEEGELDNQKTLELFAMLVKNGHAWSLQGSYGRKATQYIEAGYLDNNGNILKNISEDEG